MMSKSGNSTDKVCCFCGLSEDNELEYGKFYEHKGIITHYYCLLLSSNMEQKGNDDEGILGFLASDIQKELRRGKRLVCSYCKKNGATLGCCNTKCKMVFHFPCGLRAGSLHQFFGEFKSYCKRHRLKQKIDENIKKQSEESDVTCYICYETVNPSDYVNTLWAPCCKKNAWFHRKCVQQLAMSAGYFFKCPLCNNKTEFQQAMLKYGIFIPSQDASWELVPNAFEELLYRHDRCDATVCLCPKGRQQSINNTKWELILCRMCGSQGIHIACGKLRFSKPFWQCDECVSILGKSKGFSSSEASTTSTDESDTSFDSEDSDSDISVGTESPVSLVSTEQEYVPVSVQSEIKIPPGPRSFKLQQQLKASELLKSSQANTPNEDSTMDVENSNLDEPSSSKEDDFQQTHSSYTTSYQEEDIVTIDSEDDVNETNDRQTSVFSENIIKNTDSLKRSKFTIPNLLKRRRHDTSENESLGLKKLNLQDTNPTVVDTDQSSTTEVVTSGDSVLNIKITNVVSLAPEEFASVPDDTSSSNSNPETEFNDALSVNEHQKFSPTLLNDELEQNLKQKSEFQSQGAECNSEYATNATSKETRLDRSDKKDVLDNAYNTNSQANNVQNNWTSLENNGNKNVSDTQQNMEIAILSNSENTNKEILDVDKSVIEIPNISTTNNDENIVNCDGDAGTDPAVVKSETTDLDDNQLHHLGALVPDEVPRANCSKRSYSPPINLKTPTRHRTSSYQVGCKPNTDNRVGLIPENMKLRDLKFRVSGPNTVQMILYDTFSVDVDVDAGTRGTCLASKLSDEASSIATCSNVQNNSGFSFNYNFVHDVHSHLIMDEDNSRECYLSKTMNNEETKENLDPVTVSCNVSTEKKINHDGCSTCNTDEREENSFQCTCNPSKPEEKSIKHCGKDGNSINLESDIGTNKIIQKVLQNNVGSRQNQQESSDSTKLNLEKSHVQKSTDDRSTTIDPVCHTDTTSSPVKTVSPKNISFKVSIDLSRIKDLIDAKPELFVKKKVEDLPFSEQSNTNETSTSVKNNLSKDLKRLRNIEKVSPDETSTNNPITRNQKRSQRYSNRQSEKQRVLQR